MTSPGPRHGEISVVTWDFGDGSPIAEGWQVAHVFTSPTSVRVRVCVTNNLWCQTCDDLYPLGTSPNLLELPIALYPNPSTAGRFTLRLPSPARLIVTDALGRPLQQASMQAAETILDLSHQPSGLYLLRLTWPDGRTLTRKLLR